MMRRDTRKKLLPGGRKVTGMGSRIERAGRGESPFTVARTATGYVNLADVQYHEGYSVFVAKRCVTELHELPTIERDEFLHEMALVPTRPLMRSNRASPTMSCSATAPRTCTGI